MRFLCTEGVVTQAAGVIRAEWASGSPIIQMQSGQPPVCSSPPPFSHLALSPECCCDSTRSHWSPLSQDFTRKEMTKLVSLMPCLNFPLCFTLSSFLFFLKML
ncbi:hypothetical protein CRENBAI_003979 [Crenichthys baileyi]|uniref:Uncharacterized protein n=1 Tax=Crenichthys baileyi TaxID=28760 RepID=A0AAV9RGI9_9TELE